LLPATSGNLHLKQFERKNFVAKASVAIENYNLKSMPFAPGQSGNPAGRPRGSFNKRTRELESLIEQNGWKYPVRHFVEIYNNPSEPAERRDAAAREAAPYLEFKRGTLQLRFVEEAIKECSATMAITL
jgi:Family of unknown function (DUF5681)